MPAAEGSFIAGSSKRWRNGVMIRLTLALLAFALAAPSPAQPGQQAMTPAEKDACVARGGIVGRAGKAQIEACHERFADGGKVCTDKSQCQGACMGDGRRVTGQTATGTCQSYSRQLGCQTRIEKGAAREICID